MNDSADILRFASGVGGFRRGSGGRFNGSTRDYVATPGVQRP